MYSEHFNGSRANDRDSASQVLIKKHNSMAVKLLCGFLPLLWLAGCALSPSEIIKKGPEKRYRSTKPMEVKDATKCVSKLFDSGGSLLGSFTQDVRMFDETSSIYISASTMPNMFLILIEQDKDKVSGAFYKNGNILAVSEKLLDQVGLCFD